MGDTARASSRRSAPAASPIARIALTLTFVAGSVVAAVATTPAAGSGQPIVLLHGLLRSSSSMTRIEKALAAEGFRVCNISYPSRHHSIGVLASEHVAPAIERCFPGNTQPVGFVTHSLGGIVVRQLAKAEDVPAIGRVVMLAPPNHGSELVDEFGGWWLFRRINGPAGAELGTAAHSIPNTLGAATFEAGIITGDRTTNLVLSSFLPPMNDGKVSVASARLDGMKDFLVIPATHTFIMRNGRAIDETIRFLKHGRFDQNP